MCIRDSIKDHRHLPERSRETTGKLLVKLLEPLSHDTRLWICLADSAVILGPPGMVGWPGASQPPAPTDPYVTVSRHTALVALIIWWPVSPRPSARSTSAGMQPLVS